ncbi:MAG: DEAD/DEAH box helicase [Pseudomonadales bacterium]|nr:DEAD/DEAH box helicase [Pseudomonadales bacterium]
MSTADALTLFEQPLQDWFNQRFAAPTGVQLRSWPLIAAKQHVLITAPTGSGKTLTAFFWALNLYAGGLWQPGCTRVLYVSPLKALNNDIRRNLLDPLEALEAAGALPPLRVAVRSGDTEQSERQRLLRRPPDILITTPESLNLMLTTERGRRVLSCIEAVILDEIHALVDNRRGVQLLTALERLVDLGGEFQRIALSATVHPLDAVAAYVGGRDIDGVRRSVAIAAEPAEKRMSFRVCFPAAARQAAEQGQTIWEPLSVAFREEIAANRSTLFFTNSRRLAEKITFKINDQDPEPLAYAHHGSLSRDIRSAVEARLKAGELRAIVATSSLEMGIDIGQLDEVVLVQSPPSIAAAMQRIGRAGHNVGDVSRGVLFPTHARDFLEAAVLSQAIAERQLEPLALIRNPLDVLAQIVVSCTANSTWHLDVLFALLTRSGPYLTLPREQFDLVIEMLAGRYAGARVRELKPRLHYDRIHNTISAQRGAVLALYNAGGTIPDRGYYKIRHIESGSIIGELDEEFVWEAVVGQTFTLGTQNWQIHRITHNDVIVRTATPAGKAPPFWRSEGYDRSFYFSDRIGSWLEEADGLLATGDRQRLHEQLQSQHGFEPSAADELLDYLQRQREATRDSLPHRHHVLIETVLRGPGGYKGPNDLSQMVIHTGWGGRVNRPWALALTTALSQPPTVTEVSGSSRKGSIEIHLDDNVVVIQSEAPLDPATVLTLVRGSNLHQLLRMALEESGFFGARFRECAGRALLLSKARFNQRLPLWMSRLQAKKLLASIREFSDFPVLLETWRTCLQDEFDLPALTRMLDEIADGSIHWSAVTTSSPSPFAGDLSYDQINRYMYADDTPDVEGASSLSDALLRQAIATDSQRPRIRPEALQRFLKKRQRTASDYQPKEHEDWLEWVKERVLVPISEYLGPREGLLQALAGTRTWVLHPELGHALIHCGLLEADMLDRPPVSVQDERTASQFCTEILSFYGPLSAAQIDHLLPVTPDGLLEEGDFVEGPLMEGDETVYYCDAENFEILLRFQRALARPVFVPRKAAMLPADLSRWQRFRLTAASSSDDDALIDQLLMLRGYPAPVRVWLHDLLAARNPDFDQRRFDQVLEALGLGWTGTGRESMTVGYPEDLALLLETRKPGALDDLFRDPQAAYSYQHLAERAAEVSGPANAESFENRFWQAVWAGDFLCQTTGALVEGMSRGFRADSPAAAGGGRPNLQRSIGMRRAIRQRVRGLPGNWTLRGVADEPADPISALETDKERARTLLERYGMVCRELVNREGGALRWSRIFRALYTMELAGEVIAGYFYEGLSGPQFLTPPALQILQRDLPHRHSFWCNALDPVSPCGLGLQDDRLPQRRPHNYLCYVAGELALCVENLGRRLTFHLPPDDPALAEAVTLLVHLVRQHGRMAVETINGQPSGTSPYLRAIDGLLVARRDHKQVDLELPVG